MRISVNDLEKKIQEKPKVPDFHFPSWDYLYMRDIKKLEDWIVDFRQAFEEFKAELQERLKTAQNEPTGFSVANVLQEILGGKESSLE